MLSNLLCMSKSLLFTQTNLFRASISIFSSSSKILQNFSRSFSSSEISSENEEEIVYESLMANPARRLERVASFTAILSSIGVPAIILGSKQSVAIALKIAFGCGILGISYGY